MQQTNRSPREHGFTLIELMITIAIVGILAAIALPSYSDYILRGRITEATTGLQDARLKAEQYFLDNRKYSGTASTTGWSTGTTCPFSGPETATGHFAFTCTSDDTTYSVTATGRNAMTSFIYKINQANTRSTDGTKWGTTSTSCWQIRKGSCS